MRDPAVTPEGFVRARAVFEAALEQEPGARQAYVEAAVADDAKLRHEILSMLDAERQRDAMLDLPLQDLLPEPCAEGRFAPDTIIAGRYRILNLLGTGGMGEVYRVHDLVLNQTVALKFLAPARISELALMRFRSEVRIARQVSHPHVCRVYDVGMADGLHFLSMEYIDGEDLASRLQRLGRLPHDVALELTRRICAGLAAAHERGVVHRDLKPANIVIDSRGQPRITDFGLASLLPEIAAGDVRSGTPAYMAPEQRDGQEVTVRSDLYALGLVMREIFTGQRIEASAPTPENVRAILDPAIASAIERCLEERPERRPSSALQVALALPGGDPIAAALAAGETPSPEMVAASQQREGFSQRTALLAFAGIVVTMVVGAWFARHSDFTIRAPLDLPPSALVSRAQEHLQAFGYDRPFLLDGGFECCDPRVNVYLAALRSSSEREAALASHRPPGIFFFSQVHLNQSSPTPADSATVFPSQPGMGLVMTDAIGRLLSLEIRAWDAFPATRETNWNTLFVAARLDPGRFTTGTPRVAPVPLHEQRAWTGTTDDGQPVRVNAAAWRGRLVWIDVEYTNLIPIDVAAAQAENARPLLTQRLRIVRDSLFNIVVVILAWRNWRSHRLDVRGATLLAAVTLVSAMLLVDLPVSDALLGVATTWFTYLAVEPYVRRYWPEAMISWSRLSRGRFRSPLVASHVLAGVVVAVVFSVVVYPWFTTLAGDVPTSPWHMGNLRGTIGDWKTALRLLTLGPSNAVAYLGIVVMTRLLIRRLWLADLLAITLLNILAIESTFGGSWMIAALMMGPGLVWIWLIRRFGFLSLLSLWTVAMLLMFTPHHMSGWVGARFLPWHSLPVIVAAWACWVIASERRRPAAANALG